MFTEGEWIAIILGIIAIIIAIVAIFVPLVIERARRPNLIIRLDDDSITPRQTVRFLHCMVINDPHRHLLSSIERNPAYETRVRLTFYRNAEIILGPVETKWTDAPRCISPITQIVFNQQNQPPEINTRWAFDDTKTVFAHSRTIPSEEVGQPFDVAVKNQGQGECYAVRGWSYQFDNLADPELEIPQGELRVEMRAIASNARSDLTIFILRNTGPNITDITLVSLPSRPRILLRFLNCLKCRRSSF